MEKERGEKGQRVKVGLTGKDWKGRSRQRPEAGVEGAWGEEPGGAWRRSRHPDELWRPLQVKRGATGHLCRRLTSDLGIKCIIPVTY